MLKALGHVWTDTRIARAAAMLEVHRGCVSASRLTELLRDELEVPSLRLELPALVGELGPQWDTRAVAVQLFMREWGAKQSVLTSQSGLGSAVEALERGLVRDLKTSISRMVAVLDSEALAIATLERFDPAIYNYLARQSSRRNRLQIAATLPLFLWALSHECDAPAMSEMRHAIDGGRPLIETICRLFGVTPSTVRAVISLPMSTLGERWARQPRGLLRVLDRLVPEHRPKRDRASWDRLNVATEEAERRFGRPPWTGVLTASWIRHAMRSGSVATPGHAMLATLDQTTVRAVEDFRHALIASLAAELRLPDTATTRWLEHCVTPEVDRYVESLSLSRLVEMSTTWQRDAVTTLAGLQGGRDLATGRRYWPLLAAPFVSATSQRTIVPLTSLKALQAQGERLKVCLAAARLHHYDAQCRKGQAFIVALRDSASGAPASTMEFQVKGKRTDLQLQVEVVQHTAARNLPPAQACANARHELVEHLATAAAQRHLRVGLNALSSLAHRADTCLDDFEQAARVAAFRKSMGDQQYEELARRVAGRCSAAGRSGLMPPRLWISELLESLSRHMP